MNNENELADLRKAVQDLNDRIPVRPKRKKPKNLSKTICIYASLAVLLLAGWKVYREMEFKASYQNYMTAVQSTNNPERAKKYADRAITWLETRGLTQGRTDTVFDDGPSGDVQEWFCDVKDFTDKKVTTQPPTPPSGFFQSIALYPFNREFFLAVITAVITWLFSGLAWLRNKFVAPAEAA